MRLPISTASLSWDWSWWLIIKESWMTVISSCNDSSESGRIRMRLPISTAWLFREWSWWLIIKESWMSVISSCNDSSWSSWRIPMELPISTVSISWDWSWWLTTKESWMSVISSCNDSSWSGTTPIGLLIRWGEKATDDTTRWLFILSNSLFTEILSLKHCSTDFLILKSEPLVWSDARNIRTEFALDRTLFLVE